MDLEPKIRDLTHMAELARFHAIDTFGLNCPDETEEGKREREIALFAVVHVEQMVRDSENACETGWSQRAVSSVGRRRGVDSSDPCKARGGFRTALFSFEL
jgi:hypothetical protein